MWKGEHITSMKLTWRDVVGVEISCDDSENDFLVFFQSSFPKLREFGPNFIHGSENKLFKFWVGLYSGKSLKYKKDYIEGFFFVSHWHKGYVSLLKKHGGVWYRFWVGDGSNFITLFSINFIMVCSRFSILKHLFSFFAWTWYLLTVVAGLRPNVEPREPVRVNEV